MAYIICLQETCELSVISLELLNQDMHANVKFTLSCTISILVLKTSLSRKLFFNYRLNIVSLVSHNIIIIVTGLIYTKYSIYPCSNKLIL